MASRGQPSEPDRKAERDDPDPASPRDTLARLIKPWQDSLVLLDQTFAEVSVAELAPHPANPRKGDVAAIRESIEVNGFYGACVVQRSTGHILIGNHRWLAAKAAGEPTVPVLWVDVDDERAKRILVGDNWLSDMAGWDTQGLHDLLAELRLTEAGLAGMGVTEADMDAMLSEGQRSTGAVLDALDVGLGEPTHAVAEGQVWRLDHHVLVVTSVITGWPLWTRYLSPGCVFLPHPSPHAPISDRAQSLALVMVQPEHYIAGHLLDKWASVRSEPVLELAGAAA